MIKLVENTGFGLAFFLLSIAILFVCIVKRKYIKLLYNYFLGCLGVVLFNIIYSVSSLNENGSFFFRIGLAVCFAIALALYSGFLSGGLVIFDRKKVSQDKVYAEVVRLVIFKYNIPFVLVYIFGLLGLSVFTYFGTAPYFPLFIGVVLFFISGALSVSYFFDRSHRPITNNVFTHPKFDRRFIDRRLPAIVLIVILILGTISEIIRGFWFVWGTHVLYLSIALLVHKRYWRSVYK